MSAANGNVTELIERLELSGIELWHENGGLRFRAPEGAFDEEMKRQVTELKPQIIDELRRREEFRPDEGGPHDPFPLTEVQNAYLVGRTEAYSSGGTGCHGYAEFLVDEAVGRSVDELTTAWRAVVDCHDMLRVRVSPDGWQQVDPSVCPELEVLDRSNEQSFDQTRESVRNLLRDKSFTVGDAPMIAVTFVRSPTRAVLALAVDLLITDFRGLAVVCGDFARALVNPSEQLRRPATSFRDVVVAGQRERDGATYRRLRRRDRAYWSDRIAELPAPLRFPSAVTSDDPCVGFRRRWHVLPADQWNALTANASDVGVTPSSVFLALIARLGRRYADASSSLVTVTVHDRPAAVPDVDRIVGDFTTTVATVVDGRPGVAVAELARAAQAELFDSIDHATVSGIEVGRMYSDTHRVAMGVSPVVLTSTVGVDTDPVTDEVLVPQPGAGLSRTPQVQVDVQVSPCAGGIAIVWDYRVDAMATEVVNAAFDDFVSAVYRLADDVSAWDRDPLEPQSLPVVPVRPRRSTSLLDSIVAAADSDPDAVAVVHDDRMVTRGELLDLAAALADELRESGCNRGDAVVVRLAPGPEQIAAEFAALWLGACFVPVDVEWPAERANAIVEQLRSAGVVPYEVDGSSWPAVRLMGSKRSRPATVAAHDRAYIIFTSGSTGEPKGVVVTHAQALTTVEAVVDMLGVSTSDAVLAVSRHSFDLSIFTVFGVLGAGGRVVIPRAGTSPDAASWACDISDHSVTVWNSVPAQLSLLLDAVTAPAGLSTLRSVLVSGDWVPVDQPAALLSLAPQARFFALGGATEASIWSNVHEVDGPVAPNARSIPYGRALPGQGMWVVNSDLEPAAVWQIGEICIVGDAVASGYLGDNDRRPSFLRDPRTGQRLYRTGDLGRLLPDGEIEFLGRRDGQVKIAGHRIELGEIETVLARADGVGAAVAAAVDGRRLAAAIVPATERAEKPDPITDTVARSLRTVDAAMIEEIDVDLFARLLMDMEDVALDAMSIARTKGHTSGHEALMRRWDRHLAAAGPRPVPGEMADVLRRWDEVRDLAKTVGYGDEQLAYVRSCLADLDRVMSGETDPLALLFPHGTTDVARAAYGDNLTARYLNGLAAAAVAAQVRFLCEHGHRSSDRPVRILEVGAGVGATTAPILEQIDGEPVEYLFTDVSRFFLDDAKRRWPQIRCAHFDLTKPIIEQGIAPGSIDIVVAANVLHNAPDIPVALSDLHTLLSPVGAIAVIDSTRINAPLLVTMEFKEGLTGFTDERRDTGDAFFSRQRWLTAFERSPFTGVSVYPSSDGPLRTLPQSVMWARTDVTRAHIDVEDVRRRARHTLPEYMVPDEIFLLPSVPMTANGKVDRGAVEAIARAAHRDDVTAQHESRAAEVLDDQEQVIAAIWADVLGLAAGTPVSRSDSFFELGGDSLLLARCIGRMRSEVPGAADIPWDETMRRVVADPTLRSCTDILWRRLDEAAPAVDSGCVVELLPAAGGVTDLLVVVHDGSGDVGPYRDVIKVLSRMSSRPRVVGVRRTAADGADDLPPSAVFDVLADRYVEAVDVTSRVHLLGYCMGGLIALAMADRWASAGIDVASLTVVSSYRIPFLIQDEILIDFAFARLMGREPADLGLAIDDADLAELIEMSRIRHADCVPAGAVTELAREHFPRMCSTIEESPATPDGRVRLLARTDPDQMWTAATLGDLRDRYRVALAAVAEFDHPGYLGDITFLRQRARLDFLPTLGEDMVEYWRRVCLGELTVHDIEGTHFDCMLGDNADAVAKVVADGWVLG